MPPESEKPAPEETGIQLATAANHSSAPLSIPELSPDTDNSSALGSRAVSWLSVHDHVTPLLAALVSWPTIGTPEWCELANDDPRKIAALFDAAQHWALRLETYQAALTEASHDIAAAADWARIAQQNFRRESAIAHSTYYIPRVAS